MITARYYANLMASKGIISLANIDEAERFFLLYMEGFREQLIKDIKLKCTASDKDCIGGCMCCQDIYSKK